MHKIITIFLAITFWAASLFIRVGSMQVSQISHQTKTIYVGTAYEWIFEAVRDPIAALSSVPVIVIFGLLLVVDLLHLVLCWGLAWICIRIILGHPLTGSPPLPVSNA